jgi:predicted metal-dependent phosphoesterase TrpH
MRSMVELLKKQGIDLPFERVREEASGAVSIGRPHLARALVAAGLVESVTQAFDLYIGNDGPAYIPTRLVDTVAAIELIRKAGGLSVWAHPPVHLLTHLLPTLKEGGLVGLEVYRPRASVDRVLRLEQAARVWGLLVSGGSDWHGPDDGPFGEFRVPSSEVSALLEAGGL